MLWHISNTSVRSAMKLADAIRVLKKSNLNVSIVGKNNESAFAQLLHDYNIIELERKKDFSDTGRKWRSALDQLGFITPKLTNKGLNEDGTDSELIPFVSGFGNLSGRPYEITPIGEALGEATTFEQKQEIFLRALLNYSIPSMVEPRYKAESFYPLRLVLKVLFMLESVKLEPYISYHEMALIVQRNSSASEIVNSIRSFREQESISRNNNSVTNFYKEQYARASTEEGVKVDTINTYPNLTFKYLKSTGLFKNKGRGIGISPIKIKMAELINFESMPKYSEENYLVRLWQGAVLPFDNSVQTVEIIRNLNYQLSKRIPGLELDIANISNLDLKEQKNIQYELEKKLLELDEIEFANQQVNELDEISDFLSLLIHRKPLVYKGIRIQNSEYPAYLEWIVWRAFLAINSLVIPPWEARRFKIDQDFLPIGNAPGNGPDMIFEFDDVVIVVEVTLTSSSRQEAAEGEPVRRHVADVMCNFAGNNTKNVYGLFLAVNVDSNTAHTYKYGEWYLKDDTKMSLNIVPIALADFVLFLKSGSARPQALRQKLINILLQCRACANNDAPVWKNKISEIVNKAI